MYIIYRCLHTCVGEIEDNRKTIAARITFADLFTFELVPKEWSPSLREGKLPYYLSIHVRIQLEKFSQVSENSGELTR